MNIKRKILFIIETYPSGGSDKIVNTLSKNLSKKFNIDILINQSNDLKFLNDIKIHNINLKFYNLPNLNKILYLTNIIFIKHFNMLVYLLLKYLNFFFGVIYFIVRMVNLKPDIVISNNGNYPGGDYNRAALLSAILLKKKTIHLIHGEPRISKKLKYLFPEVIIDYLINKNATNIADSKEVKYQLKCRTRIKNIKYIYNGVKSEKVKKYNVNNKIKYISVGDISPLKNQEFLINVMYDLIHEHSVSCELLIIGQIKNLNYFNKLEQLICKLDLQKFIKIKPYQKNIYRFLYKSDVFLHSSKSESFPYSILEAMNVGLPIISSNVGGIKEQISQNKNGYLYPLNNKKKAIQKILLLKSKKLIKLYGLNSKNIFERNFTHEAMILNYNKEIN